MKKYHFMSSLLAIALIACAPLQAAKKMSFKQRAKKQFNESLDRFNKCRKGKCSKAEFLKAARDLGVAALVVAGMVGVGLFAKKRLARPQPGERYVSPAGVIFRIAANPHGTWDNKVYYYESLETIPGSSFLSRDKGLYSVSLENFNQALQRKDIKYEK